MSAVISVLASDAPSAAIGLYGTFGATNCEYLERHLGAVAGDVVVDCTKAASLDDAALAVLDRFCRAAAHEGRQVVVRGDRRPARAT